MTRLEKKCFVAATGLHGLLLVILIVGAGFRSEPKVEAQANIITLIPSEIIDGTSSGGSPDGSPAPPTPNPAPAVTPSPTPPAPAPVTPQPQPQPATPPQQKPPEPQPAVVEPPKPTPPEKVEEPDPTPPVVVIPRVSTRPIVTHKPSVKPPKEHTPPVVKKPSDIKVDISEPVSSAAEKRAAAAEAAKAQARAAARAEANRIQRIHSAINSASSGIGESISERTAPAGSVVQLGSGGGGKVFAGYRDVVFTHYYNAWTPPDNVNNQQAYTEVKVVIARDGSIISAEVVGRSGETALDRSVERALKRVVKLPPFPAGATDAQRTFRIKFDIETKLNG